MVFLGHVVVVAVHCFRGDGEWRQMPLQCLEHQIEHGLPVRHGVPCL